MTAETPTPTLASEEAAALQTRGRVAVIMMIRARLGLRLTEAADYFDRTPEGAAYAASLVPPPAPPDGLTRLATVLYGREPTPREYLGGADARILFDAANRIEVLEAYVQRIEALPQTLPVAQANARILSAAAWLARNGQQDRAAGLKEALDALSAHITTLASRLEPAPKKDELHENDNFRGRVLGDQDGHG